jgi:hypothetical protein
MQFGEHSVIARDLIEAVARTVAEIVAGPGPRLRL